MAGTRINFKITLFIASLLLTSCKNDNNTDINVIRKKIIGEWVWVNSKGGLSGMEIHTPTSTGIDRHMFFYNNDTVIVIENGRIAHNTSYYIERKESQLHNRTANILTINYKYFSNGDTLFLPMKHMIIELSDSLIIEEDVYDGYVHRYVRQGDQ